MHLPLFSLSLPTHLFTVLSSQVPASHKAVLDTPGLDELRPKARGADDDSSDGEGGEAAEEQPSPFIQRRALLTESQVRGRHGCARLRRS